jgi:hypothetical protein
MKEFDKTIEFDASKFTWNLGCGTTFASDLGLKAGSVPYVQVYNDAADVGMTLVNPKRGTKRDFVLADVLTIEGDIAAWKFKGVNINADVTIYND